MGECSEDKKMERSQEAESLRHNTSLTCKNTLRKGGGKKSRTSHLCLKKKFSLKNTFAKRRGNADHNFPPTASEVTPGETLGSLYNIHVGSNKVKQSNTAYESAWPFSSVSVSATVPGRSGR